MSNITICQIEVIAGNPAKNFETIKNAIYEHKDSEIIVFSELVISGYLIGDMFEENSFIRDCVSYNNDIKEYCADLFKGRNYTIVYGNIGLDESLKNEDGRVRKYNAIYALKNGEFVKCKATGYDFFVKTLSPNYREFEEPRHFFDNRKLTSEVTIDYLCRIDNIGYIICEDGWDSDYSVKPIELLAWTGFVDAVVNLSCSPFTTGKNISRDRVFGAHAKKYNISILYVNSIGIQNNGKTIFTFDGSSVLYSANGNVMQRASMFRPDSISVKIIDFRMGRYEFCEQNIPIQPIHEIKESLLFGIKKYLSDIGTNRVVIGISGGIDSAVAASLYAQVIGAENLLLVNMPSKYNSNTTKSIAYKIAKNIGCYYCEIPIDESVKLTSNQIYEAIPYIIPLDEVNSSAWDYTHIQLKLTPFHMENVQARDRSSRILSALSSAWGGVFTNNGNKTEATVGYCTLYGDVCGAVSALGDLWKEQVYELGRELNLSNNWLPDDVFNIVASAELSGDQDVDKGQGDPIVYWYHDRLFRSWQEQWIRLTPEEIAKAFIDGTINELLDIPKQYSVYDLFPANTQFVDDLERWWKLYKGMGIAKRVQAPPVLAVSRRSYGFDLRETLNCVHFSRKYLEYRNILLDMNVNFII